MNIKCYKISLYILLVLLLCCSENDTPEVDQSSLTCFDGILNGEEITVDCGGDCPGFCPTDTNGILEGELFTNLTLDPAVEYTLTGPYIVRDKAALGIPAGTVIKVLPNSGAYLAIAQGGALSVFGNADNPAVFTSAANKPSPGDWGGIIICGKAPIATGERGRTDITDIFYGGSEEEDTSGAINYLRIEYAGAEVEQGKKFDALTFYGVGSFTTVTRVQTYQSLGNGVRFVGGNVNPKWLVSTDSGESAVALESGWFGNGDTWFLNGMTEVGISSKMTKEVENTSTIALAGIKNISIIGPSPLGALRYTGSNNSLELDNIYTAEMSLGINIIGESAFSAIEMKRFLVDSIQFDRPGAGFIPTNYTGSNSSFYVEDTASGAGNGSLKPDWANGWTIGLEE